MANTMLVGLHVKNLALIREEEVDFEEGLNILSGETGAGKSILIGSINLALGERATPDLIREGADAALVELTFQTKDKLVLDKMEELDLPIEEDGTILLTRRIQAGKSTSKVNGETVTARTVKQLAEVLLDIHGQHEHQSLLKVEKHKSILDGYAGEELEKAKASCKEQVQLYKKAVKELEALSVDDSTRKRELDLLSFEVEEIREANLQKGEDETLEKQYQKMVSGQKIAESLGQIQQILDGNGDGVQSQIGRAIREMQGVTRFDEELEGMLQTLQDVDGLLSDFGHDLSRYESSLEFDGEAFASCEERLNQVNHLKDKYGKTIEEVLAYGEEKAEALEKLSHIEETKAELEKTIQVAKEKALKDAAKVHDLREKAGKRLQKELTEALMEMNFLHVDFAVEVRAEEEKLTTDGYDEVEFLISTNPGEKRKPLQMVASGGELSRIMLGLKTVFAEKDDIHTLIFDEIDTGISGKTAWKIAEKLGKLSKNHQVLCITHLPQIAAMADAHYCIEKTVEENRSVTRMTRLQEAERIGELARMLGSDESSEAARENAKDLIAQAQSVKA